MLFRKELLKRILLIVLSITFTFLILELAFRIFYPVKFHSLMRYSTKDWRGAEEVFTKSTIRLSRTLGYEWLPNAQLGRINSLGMFDKERLKEKPKGMYRIICLGDSTTVCTDYVKILEELLNEGKEKRFEVWNCGATGYAAIQYCRALKEKWLKCHPDMVIIGFCLNDFSTTPLLIKEGDHFVGYFPYREILPKVSPFLLKNSALYRFIVMKLFFPKKDYRDDKRFKETCPYLQDVKELLSTQKIRFLIVILGFAERFENYSLYWKRCYAEIKRIVKDYNIESVDIVPLFENFLEDNEPEELSQYDEIHFNRKGSQIIAGAIQDYLNRSLRSKKDKDREGILSRIPLN